MGQLIKSMFFFFYSMPSFWFQHQNEAFLCWASDAANELLIFVEVHVEGVVRSWAYTYMYTHIYETKGNM